MSANVIPDLIFMFRANDISYYIFDTKSDITRRQKKGVSEERGRRKTAELQTSGAKRAETWRGL